MARNIGRPIPVVPSGQHDADVQRGRKTVLVPGGKTIAGAERLSVGPGTRIVDLTFEQTETDTDAGGAPLPATTVASMERFSQVPVVGVGKKYAREDHDHGTPTPGELVFSGGRADTVFDGTILLNIRLGGA
jgi:hypothetical protein